MDEERQDLVDRYVRGEMTPQEEEELRRMAETDPELKEQCEFTADVTEAMRSRNEKLRKMKAWDEKADMERGTRSRHRAVAWLSAAIAAAAVVVAIVMVTLPRGAQLPPLDMAGYGGVRGGSGIGHMAALVDEGRYDEALTLIDAALNDAEATVKAWRDMPQGTPADERERMEYEAMAAKADADELAWLKVYALEGLGRHKEAMAQLGKIRATEGKYRHVADSIYNEWK